MLLPLVSALTVLAMFCITEAVTRVIWNSHEDNTCSIDGFRVKPNCTARSKTPEGPWATYRFNECAYRSNTSCGPVPPGTVRIAILGASVSQGMNIPYEDTYFARSADELGHRCGFPIDVQNLGKPNSSPIYAYRRVEEVLKLKPDVVLFLLAPFDIEQQIDPQVLAHRNDPEQILAPSAVHEPLSLMRRLQKIIIDSRTMLVAEHYLPPESRHLPASLPKLPRQGGFPAAAVKPRMAAQIRRHGSNHRRHGRQAARSRCSVHCHSRSIAS